MAFVVPTIHPAAVLHSGKPITDVICADLAKGYRISQEGPRDHGQILYVLPSSPHGLAASFDAACKWLDHWNEHASWVAVDIETSGLDYFNCRFFSIAVSAVEEPHVGVAFSMLDYHTLVPWMEEQLVWRLRRLLANPDVGKIYHNAPFDQAVLYTKGFKLAGKLYDTLGGAHLVQSDSPAKDLGWTGQTYLDVRAWKIDHKGNKLAFTRDPDELLYYNAEDALYTAQIMKPQLEDIDTRCQPRKVLELQMGLIAMATRMEVVGLPIDHDKRRRMGLNRLKKKAQLKHWLRESLNWPDFNPMSGDHRREALFGPKYAGEPWNLGIRPEQFTPTGLPATGRKPLCDHLENKVVRSIVDYMEMSQMYSTVYAESHGVEILKLKELGLDEELAEFKKKPPKHEKGGSYTRAIGPDGRLHVKWNPCGTTGSRFSSSPNCFDAETEVLTRKGWVKFPEAVANWEGLRFAQYNPESEKVTFCRALGAICAPGRPQAVLGQQVDIRATGDHRVPLREYNPNKHAREISVMTLGDLPQHKRLIHAGQFAFGSFTIGEARLRLIVACQADGSWSHKGIAFDFKKEKKYRRLRALLDACDASYSFKEKPHEAKHRWALRVKHTELTTVIKGYIGQAKTFGPWLLDLTKAEAAVFLDEVWRWDGSEKKHRFFYYSRHETNASWVQIMAILQGYRSSVCWAGTCYRTMIAKDRAYSSARLVPEAPGTTDENTYCIEVPRGFILTRRKGKAVVLGNCQNLRAKDRAFVRTAPGWTMVGSDKDQLELRIIACFAGVEPLLKIMADPNGDPHTYAAERIYGAPFLASGPRDRKNMRTMVKTVTYASIYMAMITTVWRTIREGRDLDPALRAAMTLPEVTRIYNGYFGLFPEIEQYHMDKMKLIERQGFIEHQPLGRRHYFPVQPPPFNEVANRDIQCAGSDDVGMQMLEVEDQISKRFPGEAFMIMHLHDQLDLECKVEHAEECAKIVKRTFGATYMDGPKGRVYLTAEPTIADNLKDAK